MGTATQQYIEHVLLPIHSHDALFLHLKRDIHVTFILIYDEKHSVSYNPVRELRVVGNGIRKSV